MNNLQTAYEPAGVQQCFHRSIV